MEPGRKFDTLEDLLDHLIVEGETVALQEARRMMEENRGFDLDSLIISLAEKENKDETEQTL